MIRKQIDTNQELTKEQLEILQKAEKMPIVYDDDSPKLSDEELSRFYRKEKRLTNS